jgi:hypothetical protein
VKTRIDVRRSQADAVCLFAMPVFLSTDRALGPRTFDGVRLT